MTKTIKYIGFFFWITVSFAEENRTDVRKTLLNDVDQSWQVSKPISQVIKEDVPAKELEPVKSIETRLKTIIIPKLCISGLPLGQALSVLTEIVRVYNFNDQGINFVLIDPDQKAKTVHLDVNNISLWKIIQYLQEQTKFEICLEEI